MTMAEVLVKIMSTIAALLVQMIVPTATSTKPAMSLVDCARTTPFHLLETQRIAYILFLDVR